MQIFCNCPQSWATTACVEAYSATHNEIACNWDTTAVSCGFSAGCAVNMGVSNGFANNAACTMVGPQPSRLRVRVQFRS